LPFWLNIDISSSLNNSFGRNDDHEPHDAAALNDEFERLYRDELSNRPSSHIHCTRFGYVSECNEEETNFVTPNSSFFKHNESSRPTPANSHGIIMSHCGHSSSSQHAGRGILPNPTLVSALTQTTIHNNFNYNSSTVSHQHQNHGSGSRCRCRHTDAASRHGSSTSRSASRH
jgi:hypothetical protein